MAQLHEKLAASLRTLQSLQAQGRHVVRSDDLSRLHRERLVASGFLEEIIKGWYVITRPDDQPGDSTAWYVGFHEFISLYCTGRFGNEWYLSPESSLLQHVGATAIQPQVIVHAREGKNNKLDLPFNTFLIDYRAKDFASPNDVVVVDYKQAVMCVTSGWVDAGVK